MTHFGFLLYPNIPVKDLTAPKIMQEFLLGFFQIQVIGNHLNPKTYLKSRTRLNC
jgi:hypothetical protein